MADAFSKGEVVGLVFRLTLVSVVTFVSIKWILNQVDPTNKTKKKAREKAEQKLKKLAATGTSQAPFDTFSDYEMMIAAHLVSPQDIHISWEDIAGLESLIQELRETVILPIQKKDLFADSQLTSAPKGVLLHGPPGCGKTLIAKATAREACTRFINLDLSLLTDKWYGESQKLTGAVFSLACKLQPCIIFIDEIDSFLRSRTNTDHEATAMMKAQFMALWDGLVTDTDCTVVIMGATNRPQDLDRAILRRMPATFHVPMPNAAQRLKIIQLILKNEPISSDINFENLAQLTEGFSGSDLKEMCRNASIYRVRDYMRSHVSEPSTSNSSDELYHDPLRPITMEDLQIFESLDQFMEDSQCFEGLFKKCKLEELPPAEGDVVTEI